jgi:hypothetical protein
MAFSMAMVLIFLMVAMSAWGWAHIPPGQSVAIHWALNGRPNGYAPRLVALLTTPMVAVVLVALVELVLTRATGGHYGAGVLGTTEVVATTILCITHGVIVGAALGSQGA